MIVESGDAVVKGSAVEDLPDLLKETLPVELSGRHEGVLLQ